MKNMILLALCLFAVGLAAFGAPREQQSDIPKVKVEMVLVYENPAATVAAVDLVGRAESHYLFIEMPGSPEVTTPVADLDERWCTSDARLCKRSTDLKPRLTSRRL